MLEAAGTYLACLGVYSDRSLRLAAIRTPGAQEVWHTYAVWGDHAFDASGWHPERELLRVNEAFEGRALQGVPLVASLDDFCVEHHHRPSRDFWAGPWPRAQATSSASCRRGSGVRKCPVGTPERNEVPGRRA